MNRFRQSEREWKLQGPRLAPGGALMAKESKLRKQLHKSDEALYHTFAAFETKIRPLLDHVTPSRYTAHGPTHVHPLEIQLKSGFWGSISRAGVV